MALFHTFTNLFNIWLNRRPLNSHISFNSQSDEYVVFVEIYEENPALHRYVAGRERMMQSL